MTHPLLYEINTRCWLRDWSDRLGQKITLANVPETEFAAWQRLGFTHVWLMGAWTTGPQARERALQDPAFISAYDELLPGWRKQDIGGSPFSIAAYEVPAALGGEAGLGTFRERLHARGLKLVLDFVPNHLGFDHPWTVEQPDRFVQAPGEAEGTFAVNTATAVRWLAHGKDPHFAPWTDTVQLDYRRAETRAAVRDLLQHVAARCDGVRCDMAMLLLNDVFARTWEAFPCPDTPPATEFWAEAIPTLKTQHPDFLFLAEAYWGLEDRLQALGFDFTYDKQLCDELLWGNGNWAQRRLLGASPEFVAASAHFLENHDERRVAEALELSSHRAAALVMLGLPGLRLLHEGQLTGARLKLPVQLARRPLEIPVAEVQQMYERILTSLPQVGVGQGKATLIGPRPAWPENPTGQNFILVLWQSRPDEFALVAVNLAPHRSQCYAPLALPDLADRNWSMRDLLSDERYERFGSDLQSQGLFLDLPTHGAQLFHFQPVD
jgi:hypothetical protein